jgi:hypothetical protein
MGVHELSQQVDRSGVRFRVGVGDDDVRRARGRDPLVCVGCEAERALVHDELRVDRWDGRVRDDDELVDLRRQRIEATLESRVGPVRDDDGRDAQTSSRYTASVRLAVSAQLN